MRTFTLFAVAVCLCGCVSSYDHVVDGVNELPRSQQPAYIASSYESGKISTAQRDHMMMRWEKVNAEEKEEAAMLAKMTPYEQAQYKLQKRQVEIQEEQLAQSYAAARDASIRDGLNTASESNARNLQTISNNANTQSLVNAINR